MARRRRKTRSEMPRNIKLVRSPAHRHIAYQIKFFFLVEHPPAVDDWRRQPGISVVTPLKQIKLPARDPLLDGYLRKLVPGKRTRGLGLIQSIDLHGVVSGGATPTGALAARAQIFECSRIDQKISPVSNQTNAQSIGVTMSSSRRSQGAGINE